MPRLNAQSKLGDYFVAFGLATRKQIDSVRKGLAPGQMLGQALTKAKIVDNKLCEDVARVQRLYRRTAAQLREEGVEIVLDGKSFIGDILVALGSITRGEKDAWLKYQDEERARGNDPGRLGELLVERNVCTAEERDLAMRVQDWLRGVK